MRRAISMTWGNAVINNFTEYVNIITFIFSIITLHEHNK